MKYVFQNTSADHSDFNSGVHIIQKTDSFFLQSKVVFIPGFSEAFWPGKTKEDCFLTDLQRKVLGLPFSQLQYDKNLYLLLSQLQPGRLIVFTSAAKIENQPEVQSHFF